MSTLQRDPDERVQVLDEAGRVREGVDVPDLTEDELVEMYEQMRLVRRFDERAVSLQRQGRMGTYPPLSGQEAAQVGSAHALADDDWVFPSYREHGVGLVRGLSLERTLLYWMGHEQGNYMPEDVNIFSVAVPIATQIPHATGAAWASKLQGEEKAFVCYFGDGATSEGDFHEGLNFAGVFDTPNVFFCNNNQWAISVPRERQTASATLAQKATAYGFEGVQVDGNDPLAVHETVSEALADARAGEPVLVESLTYRQGAHTTSDDPDRYRPEDEDLPEWRTADPVERFESYLREQGVVDDEFVADCREDAEAELDDAVETAEAVGEPDVDELFDYVYEERTPRIDEQRDWLHEWLEDHDPQEQEF